ncbi:unnamed protein product [Rhizophagus irregularis]|nr:unnamed protein product [Rhizophagus irregularis]
MKEYNIIVNVIDDPPSQTLKLVRLNLEDNLLEIRQELEKKEVIDNSWLFSKKYPENNNTSYGFAEIAFNEEEFFLLNDIIDRNSNTLYLKRQFSWSHLNELHKLDYGCTMTFDGIKRARSRAFEMKNCELTEIGPEGCRKGSVEYKSNIDRMMKTNLFFGTDINVQDFARLGLSIEKMKNEGTNPETSTSYFFTEYGKASLKFSEHLEPTQEFIEVVEKAIKSQDPVEEFKQITDKFGQFIPTEVILGGRARFEVHTAGNSNKVAKNANAGEILGISAKENSTYYKSMKLIGGEHPDNIENFHEEAWVKSLEDYRNWGCIEFRDPISIFQILPKGLLHKQIIKSIGKRIHYSSIEELNCTFSSQKPFIMQLNMPQNILKMVIDREADCNIFATVIDTTELKNGFFTCQVFCPPDRKPSLIIHCVQNKFKRRKCELKIGWMVIGYCTDFNSILLSSNIKLKVLKNDFNTLSNQIMIGSELLDFEYDSYARKTFLCLGSPVLTKLDTSNSSLVIGHHFFDAQEENKIGIRAFSYCLKRRCYVGLPEFTFYTLIIDNPTTSNTCRSLPFRFSILKQESFFDLKKDLSSHLNPKYISVLCLSKDNYKPFFLKQKIEQIKIKYVYCNCGNTCVICKNETIKLSENNAKCGIFDPSYISIDSYKDNSSYIGSYEDSSASHISDTTATSPPYISHEDDSASLISDSTTIISPSYISDTATATSSSNTSHASLLEDIIKSINDNKGTIQPENSKCININKGTIQLNHSLFLNEIKPENSEWAISLYNGQPQVYININDSSDICIYFPVIDITIYDDDLRFSKSFQMCLNGEEFFAKEFSFGGKLIIKDGSVTQQQIDILGFYLFNAYNSAKYSINIQFNNFFTLNILPKMETLSGEKLNTYEELINWMNNLYKMTGNLTLIYSMDCFETERRTGVTSFKEQLNLKDWFGDAIYNNLISWAIDFNLFRGLIINQNCELEISKKIGIDFIKIPKVNLSDKSYLKAIRPSTKLEVELISNNVFPIKNLNSFPFIKSDVEIYEDFNYILVKFERYEILLSEDSIKPTKEFEQIIEKSLNSMKPLKDLQHVFDDYGHLFPQRIILGRSLKIILPNTPSYNNTLDDVNDVDNILKSLKNLNISYLLTQEGESIEIDDLQNWIKDANYNLAVIEFDNIIPLYKILEVKQQKKINDILDKFNDLQNYRIIMTGITDLTDLNNSDDVMHYKRINVESSLEDENYEVFGSIISESNTKLEEIYVNFELYDFNGFYAIIRKSEETNIDITKCYVLWMIVGIPSQLSVFSPNNRDFQVDYFKKSIKLQNDQLNYYIDTPFTLYEGNTIFAHAYYSSTNYEPNNIIKLVKWSINCINFQITNSSQLDTKEINIDLNVCILSTDYKGKFR